ncbi:MAG TPA: FCD domain-containing protein [Casimicrobiaceae bacterium]
MSEAAVSPLDFLQRHSLTSALKSELQRLILNGEIGPGERLNETALAARFRTSRGPLREALQALGELGLVGFSRNRGAFIRRVSPPDAVDLYGVRAALEDQVGRTLAKRLTPAQAGTLRALVADMDRQLKANKRARCYELNLRFHDRIVEYAGNARLAAMYRQVVNELQLFRMQGLVHGPALEVTNAEHRAIVEALETRQPERAASALRAHAEAALRRVERGLRSVPARPGGVTDGEA